MRAVRPAMISDLNEHYIKSLTDAMNEFIGTIMFIQGKVKVDHMHNMLDIQTTSGDSSSDEDRRLASFERTASKCELT